MLNVFKHFKTENPSSNENAVITLTLKVPRIVKHGFQSPSKSQPNRKKEFNKLDEFNLGVVRRMIHQLYARGESFANIYFFKAEISSKICKNSVKHVKYVEKSYWKTDRAVDTKLDKLQLRTTRTTIANTVTQLKMNRRFIQVDFQFTLFSYLKNFTIIQIHSLCTRQ